MFDLQATLRWVTGVIKTPQETAKAYREADPSWSTTFVQLPLPLLVVAGLLGWMVSSVTGSLLGAGFGAALVGIVGGLVWTFVLAFIFDLMAGFFDGEKNFNRAYGLVGLVTVISAIGSVLGAVAWVGWLLSLAAMVYAIYLAYQFVPIFLSVPEDNRFKHIVSCIVLSIVASFVVFGIVGSVMGGMALSRSGVFDADDEVVVSQEADASDSGSLSGMFGGLERQAKLAEQAAADRYDPPSDGELDESQVERYVSVLRKTAALRDRLQKKYEKMDEGEAGLGDLLGGVGDFARIGTAEQEVVKTGGGNWAEHQWVREQLEVARVQQDTSDAVKHNYALFLKYQEEIESLE